MTVLKQVITFVSPQSFFLYSCSVLTVTASDVVRSYNEPWPKIKGWGETRSPSWECACSPCSGATCQLYHPLTCRGMSSFKDIISRGQRQGCQPVTNSYISPLFPCSCPKRTSIRPIPHLAPTRFIAICCPAGCSNLAALRHSRAKAQRSYIVTRLSICPSLSKRRQGMLDRLAVVVINRVK